MSENGEAVTEYFRVNNVLEVCIMGFYAALCEKGIEPSVRITEKKIIRNLDRADLSRVFSNLLANALKYSGGDLEITLDDDGEVALQGLDNVMSSEMARRVGESVEEMEDIDVDSQPEVDADTYAKTMESRHGFNINENEDEQDNTRV